MCNFRYMRGEKCQIEMEQDLKEEDQEQVEEEVIVNK